MSKIIELNEALTNRIAAGEVVERPAGIVKELVENAIDAQATQILISFQDGGLKKIIVSDNGEGMDKFDLRNAFKRHATSKIKKEADLNSIHSLGFRGEALPSIASVSKVMASSNNGEDAYQIMIDNGVETQYEASPQAKGTTIEVTDLFYKVPARLKHLKTPQYETARIKGLIHNFALGYPQIAFKVLSDDKLIINTKGNGKLDEILYQIYGVEVAQLVRPFSAKSNNFTISGVYVLPHIHRANKYHEFIYLNSRMINLYPMNQVIDKVFHSYMPIDRYPIIVMNIESDAQLVDVNVHPAKWTVRISQENELLNLAQDALRESLSSHMGVKKVSPTLIEKPQTITIFESVPQPYTYPTESFEVGMEEELIAIEPEVTHNHIRVLAQHHGKYILAEDENGLYLFDQHASMERVQYESFQEKMREAKHEQQHLLVPIVIKSMDPLIAKMEETAQTFEEFGITVEQFSQHDLVVRSIPLWMQSSDPINLINGLFDSLANDDKYNLLEVNAHKLATQACKSSIRFNERRSLVELQKIIDDLMRCQQPYHCPHGRPTFVRIDADQLLKEFSR